MCLDSAVNFAPGHVEYADLFVATDDQGQTHYVMIPDVCGNVSVLKLLEPTALRPGDTPVVAGVPVAPVVVGPVAHHRRCCWRRCRWVARVHGPGEPRRPHRRARQPSPGCPAAASGPRLRPAGAGDGSRRPHRPGSCRRTRGRPRPMAIRPARGIRHRHHQGHPTKDHHRPMASCRAPGVHRPRRRRHRTCHCPNSNRPSHRFRRHRRRWTRRGCGRARVPSCCPRPRRSLPSATTG
jgi:hypothetical protein